LGPDTVEAIVNELERCNTAYRSGSPIVSDLEYDAMVEGLRELSPDHPFLLAVESENFEALGKVRHPVPMLSTEKAYDKEALQRWVDRVRKAAAAVGVTDIEFRMTPKLDGLAGRDDGTILATRGNGRTGSDITDAFDKGVVPLGGRGLGLGEIVILQSAFEAHFSDEFEHPRNMAVGIISADTVSPEAQRALDMGIVHFVPYVQLADWRGSGDTLVAEIDRLTHEITDHVDYAMDGMVAQATDRTLQAHMGATAHHYRWQIAIKQRGETAITTIEHVVWQTGRTGNVTPVLEIEPTRLSGATIRRVTAHHAGLIRDKNLGQGAQIEIIRSGEVIPKLEQVIAPGAPAALPATCPSCDAPLSWQRDFLRCENANACPAQVAHGLRHWFRTLESADWFGLKTIERLVAGGFDTLEKVYALTEEDLITLEFGPGQTHNLLEALQISRDQRVEDARFLAAFGIADLGIGESRNLLAHFGLEELNGLQAEPLRDVKGFGEITSVRIVQGLQQRWSTIQHMLDLGFSFHRTPLAAEQDDIEGPIAGKKIVFTGTMSHQSRDDMKEIARMHGAKVQSSVSGNTDLLVVGEKPGASKVRKAEQHGVEVMGEEGFLELIGMNAE